MHVAIVNGPNLNLLGTRRTEIYGELTLRDLESRCRAWAMSLGLTIDVFQSNHEGAIIDRLHATIGTASGVVLNPGALAHYSYAIHDAVESIPAPVVEVHISDISSREEWRRISVVSAACAATISGKGFDGYREALETLARVLERGT
jgi:3-dehydroquinate dehydratase type II